MGGRLPVVFSVLEHMERLTEAEGRYRVRGEVVEPFGNVHGLSGMVFDSLDELVRVKDDRGVVGAEGFCCEGPFPRDAAALVMRGSVPVELEG